MPGGRMAVERRSHPLSAMTRDLLSVLIVLLPAAYAAWSGRRLLRRLEEPLFTELHFARAQRLLKVLLICFVAGSLISADRVTLKMALAVLALAVAEHGYRKQVFRETWNVIGYLGHNLRVIGLLGAWLLVAFAPTLILWSGDLAVPAAIAIGALVLAISLLYAPWVRWLLGAVSLADPDLETRFEEILARASCRRPAIWSAGPAGGFWMNALAVPSLTRPAVVLSRDLLACLGPRETTAIFAHEVAHLEKHLRGWQLIAGHLVLWALATVALAGPFLLGPSTVGAAYFAGFWPLVVVLKLALQAARSQRREFESDLRAYELCGDAPALIDALTKLHVLSRMPRRWAAGSETRMTHPSLAQRLRAIRNAAAMEAPGSPRRGANATQMAELAVVAAGDSERAAVLAADRVHWLAGLPADVELDAVKLRESAPDRRSIRYSDLADLRLIATGSRRQRLVATDRQGQTLELPVRASDVPAVQAALERVEHELPGTAPGMSQLGVDRSTRSVWVRLEALLLVILGVLPPSSGTLSLASFLVLLRPATPTLAAAGGVAVGAALLGFWGVAFGRPVGGWLDVSVDRTTVLFGGVIFLLAGAYFLALTARRVRARLAEPRWLAWGVPALLGFAAALSAAGGLLRLAYPMPAPRIHLWAQEGPAAILWLVGLAATFLTVRRPVARFTAAASLVAVAVLLALGSSWFGDRAGRDPLSGPMPALAEEQPELLKVRELELPENPMKLALSPSGRLAFSTDYPQLDPRIGRHDGFEVELEDGSFVTVDRATVVEFIDDERVVALVPDDGRTLLRILRLGAEPAVESEIDLPALETARLTLNRGGARWEVVGTVGDRSEILRFAGDLAGAWEEIHRVPLPAADDASVYLSYLNSAGHLLAVDRSYGFPGPLRGTPGLLLATLAGSSSTRISTYDATGPQRIAESSRMLSCFEPISGQVEFLCASLGEDEARLWWIDVERERLRPGGSVPDLHQLGNVANDGRLLLASYSSPVMFLDPSAGKTWRLGRQVLAEPAVAAQLGPAGEPADGSDEETPGALLSRYGAPAVALRSGLMAVAVHGRNGATALVYRQPDSEPSEVRD